MLYRINKWLKGHPDKSSQDEFGAHNENEVKILMDSLGYDYTIIERLPDTYNQPSAQPIGDSIKTANQYDQKIPPFRPDGEVIKPNNGTKISPTIVSTPQVNEEKEIYFSDGTDDFMVKGTKLYKKDWIIINDRDNYKISNYTTEGSYDLFKRDWIEVNKK